MNITSSTSDQQFNRAQLSCHQCRRLKKKCDRQRPVCALCLRQGRTCSFAAPSTLTDVTGSPTNEIPSSLLVQGSGSSITATYYLDHALLHRSVSQLPAVQFTPDPILLGFLGDLRADQGFVSLYFTVLHPWTPFLSKKHFMERVLNPLNFVWPWNLLLLAAMRLLTTTPSGPNPRSTFYIALRANVYTAIDSGLLELRIFQTLLFLSAYELGHGIYPAAYMTIRTCVCYGNALGLDKSIESDIGGSQSDIEAEENRRSWWTLLLLDKYLSLGSKDRKPAACCLSKDAILPADDVLWEKADQSQLIPHRWSEPLSADMGRFCLTAQVTILLERIMQNIGDKSSQNEFREQEAKVLDDAIAALTRVALQEAQSRGVSLCSPITACYSARMLLHDHERAAVPRPPLPSHRASHTLLVESEIAATMLKIARSTCTSSRCGEEEYTPFCIEALYRSGVFFARRYQTIKDQEDLQAFQTIKTMLDVVNGRWKVAGLYSQMLEVRSLSGIL